MTVLYMVVYILTVFISIGVVKSWYICFVSMLLLLSRFMIFHLNFFSPIFKELSEKLFVSLSTYCSYKASVYFWFKYHQKWSCLFIKKNYFGHFIFSSLKGCNIIFVIKILWSFWYKAAIFISLAYNINKRTSGKLYKYTHIYIYVASYYSIRVILLTSCSSFSDFGEAERFPWLLPFISSITVAMATQIRNQHSLIFPIMAKIIKWYENNIALYYMS